MNFRQTGIGNVECRTGGKLFRVSPGEGMCRIEVDIVSPKVLCYPAICFEAVPLGFFLSPARFEEAPRMMA
jgi:hypothetical protein